MQSYIYYLGSKEDGEKKQNKHLTQEDKTRIAKLTLLMYNEGIRKNLMKQGTKVGLFVNVKHI